MYEPTAEIYLEIAERLFERIGSSEFFSGTVVAYDDDVECRLTCTVVVRRATHLDAQLGLRPISRVLPVWWEMKTYRGGCEVQNDFSFFDMLLGQCGGE